MTSYIMREFEMIITLWINYDKCWSSILAYAYNTKSKSRLRVVFCDAEPCQVCSSFDKGSDWEKCRCIVRSSNSTVISKTLHKVEKQSCPNHKNGFPSSFKGRIVWDLNYSVGHYCGTWILDTDGFRQVFARGHEYQQLKLSKIQTMREHVIEEYKAKVNIKSSSTVGLGVD